MYINQLYIQKVNEKQFELYALVDKGEGKGNEWLRVADIKRDDLVSDKFDTKVIGSVLNATMSTIINNVVTKLEEGTNR